MTRRTLEWSLVAVALIDLAGRQLTRRSVLAFATGSEELSPWWGAALAVTGTVLLLVGVTRRRAPAVLLACAAVGIAAQLSLGARLQSDGFYYFAFTRSMWFDRDLNLTNDYALLGVDDPQHQFLLVPTPTGYAQSAWAIGPAIASMPFFAIGHVSAAVLASSGVDVATDGTSFPYRQAVCLAGLTYGLLGLWWSYLIAARVSAARDAAMGVAAIAGGSFVLWYLVREPTMSHSVSMAAVAGFIALWLDIRAETSWRRWALLGLVGGVMVIMRWQNAVVLLVPTLGVVRQPRLMLSLAGGVLVGVLPQMWTWHALYGAWITQPPVSPRLHWLNAQWIDVLWSSRSGLFATSPAAYLGALGLLPLTRHERWLGAAGVVTFVLMTWTNGAVEDWWAGASFGGRRFDSLVPFFVAGCAVLSAWATRAVQRQPAVVAAASVAILAVWNVTLTIVARGGTYRIGQIVSFGDLAAAQARVVHEWIGHPPSFPANLLWALANETSPSQFDILRPNRFLSDPARPFGRIDVGLGDDPFLGNGWYGAERTPDLTFRWASARASVSVPLSEPAPLWLQLNLAPFDAPGLEAQRLTVEVNGSRLPEIMLETGWRRIEIPTDATVWTSGVNHVELLFSRETRPVDLGGQDPRLLAAAIDYVRIQKR